MEETPTNQQGPEQPKEPAPQQCPHTEPSPAVALNNQEKIFGAIAYIGPLFIIPLLLNQKSQFSQFHGAQGLMMFIASFVIILLSAITSTISILLFLAYLIIAIMAITKALKGEKWQIPGIFLFVAKIHPEQYTHSFMETIEQTKKMEKPRNEEIHQEKEPHDQ